MRIISISNQKGGVGKTTTTVNLGAALNLLGQKVLIIDFDPQSNTTSHFGLNPDQLPYTNYETLKKTDILPAIQSIRPGLDLAPAGIMLASSEIELVTEYGREYILKKSMSKIPDKSYDFVLIDCPPSLSLLVINALTASSEIFIILHAEFFALKGVRRFIDTVAMVKNRLNNNLEITGVIKCLYNSSRTLTANVSQQIDEAFGKKVFKTVIRVDVKLGEAPIKGKDIFNYAPKSHGAEDYMNLAKEVLNHA